MTKRSFFIKKSSLLLLLISGIGVLLCVLGFFLNYEMSNIAAVYVLLMSFSIVVYVHNNFLLTIMFSVICYCNYSAMVAEYLSVIRQTLFTTYAGTYIAAKGVYILLLFMTTIGIMLSFVNISKTDSISSKDLMCNEKNNTLYIIVAALELLLIYILIFAFGRPDQIGDRGSPTALYEYSILLFIICFYYGGNNKLCRRSTIAILILFVLQNFAFGGRITGLQLLIVAYVMVIEERLNLKKALPIIIVGFVLLSVIGIERGNLLSGSFDVTEVAKELGEKKFTLDTAYSSYHTSMTFLLAEENITIGTRLSIFVGFLKSIIFGKYDTVNSNVSSYTSQMYRHYGGGFLPFFFEFYLGIFGIYLISMYLMKFIKDIARTDRNSSGLKKCVGVYIVASSFRWYIYSPIQITRGILLLVVCYELINITLKRGKTIG